MKSAIPASHSSYPQGTGRIISPVCLMLGMCDVVTSNLVKDEGGGRIKIACLGIFGGSPRYYPPFRNRCNSPVPGQPVLAREAHKLGTRPDGLKIGQESWNGSWCKTMFLEKKVCNIKVLSAAVSAIKQAPAPTGSTPSMVRQTATQRTRGNQALGPAASLGNATQNLEKLGRESRSRMAGGAENLRGEARAPITDLLAISPPTPFKSTSASPLNVWKLPSCM